MQKQKTDKGLNKKKHEEVKWKYNNKLYRLGLSRKIYNLNNRHNHNELIYLDNFFFIFPSLILLITGPLLGLNWPQIGLNLEVNQRVIKEFQLKLLKYIILYWSQLILINK